jgi:hypothetical protein
MASLSACLWHLLKLWGKRKTWTHNPFVAGLSAARPTLKFLVRHPGLPPLYSHVADVTANVLYTLLWGPSLPITPPQAGMRRLVRH